MWERRNTATNADRVDGNETYDIFCLNLRAKRCAGIAAYSSVKIRFAFGQSKVRRQGPPRSDAASRNYVDSRDVFVDEKEIKT